MRIEHGADVCVLPSNEGLITPSVDVSPLIERILSRTQNRETWLHVPSIIMNSIQEQRKIT